MANKGNIKGEVGQKLENCGNVIYGWPLERVAIVVFCYTALVFQVNEDAWYDKVAHDFVFSIATWDATSPASNFALPNDDLDLEPS